MAFKPRQAPKVNVTLKHCGRIIDGQHRDAGETVAVSKADARYLVGHNVADPVDAASLGSDDETEAP